MKGSQNERQPYIKPSSLTILTDSVGRYQLYEGFAPPPKRIQHFIQGLIVWLCISMTEKPRYPTKKRILRFVAGVLVFPFALLVAFVSMPFWLLARLMNTLCHTQRCLAIVQDHMLCLPNRFSSLHFCSGNSSHLTLYVLKT